MERSSSRKTGYKAALTHPAVNSAIGAGVAIVVSIALLMIASAMTLSGTIAEEHMKITSVACGALSVFAGSKVAAKRVSEKKLFVAVGAAVITFIVVFAIGRVISDQAASGGFALFSGTSSLGAGILAGLQRDKTKRRTKKR
ncbi:MAG: TIGR04086 family membrane protein [Oscillospiraceae bacterium]|jgi:putative membrane protein (TIGR04086 family)|nr:TIGR04086 family membrane protein [Oscillospiraceae bacterium]